MRKVYFILLGMITYGETEAQLAGTKNIPGDYPDLSTAVAALNTQGVGPGGVTFNLIAGNPQTAPAGGYTISTLTSNGSKKIIFIGNDNIITAPAPQTAGNINDAIFKIIGSDYVTIRGFNMQENAGNTTTVVATNDMTEFGVAIFYATPTDGAHSITIQNNTISLNRTYTNTFGIFSTSRTNATALTTPNEITSPAGANHNLHIYNNNISNVNTGLVSVGALIAANMTTGLDVGGSGPSTGNTISNFGTGASGSVYSSAGSLTVNGIYVNNNINFNVSHNSVTSSDGGITTNSALRGIYVQGPFQAFTIAGAYSNVITHNNISLRSGATSAIIAGIANEMGNPAISLNISNNNFHNTTHTIASSGLITFILNSGACQNTTISNNTFTNLNVNTTGNVSFITNSVSRPTNAITVVNNNSIITGFTKTGAGGNVQFYFSGGGTHYSATETNSNNNFSNVTVTGSTSISGWNNTDGIGLAYPYGPAKTVTGNTFSNIIGGPGNISLLTVGYSNAKLSTNNISNNTLSGVSCAGFITGIASTQGSQNFFGNSINNFTSINATLVTGFSLSTGSTQNIYKNKIFDLRGTSSGSTVYGISITGPPTVANIYNNLIGLLSATVGSGTDIIRGISIAAIPPSTTLNISYNTIFLNTTSSATNFGSSGIFHTVSTTPTTSALILRNNIIVNTSIAKGIGRTVAYRRSGTTLNNYDNASNNNLLYAGTPGSLNLIFFDGTNSDQTLAAFKSRVAPRESYSVTENPAFISIDGNNINFFHLNPAIGSQAESGAVPIAGFIDDYDGAARNASAPDIGADEGSFTMNDLSGPIINYTNLELTCSTGDRVLSNVNISDATGVPTSSSLVPRIYYRKGLGAWFSQPGTLSSGTATNGVWNFVIVAASMGGLAISDVVSYYVIAQDVVPAPNISSKPVGIIATNVNSVTTHPSSPNTYTIGGNLSGTFQVGAGQAYPSITAAANAYNNSCLTGPVVFELTDETYNNARTSSINSETFPINFGFNPYASPTNIVVIRPSNGQAITITGAAATPAIFKLNGARYVTIDGVNSGGTSLSLVTMNPNNSAAVWLAQDVDKTRVAANKSTCCNNLKKIGLAMHNLIDNGSLTTFGINASPDGAFPTTNPVPDVDDVTIEGVDFERFFYAIFACGTNEESEGGLDNWMILRNRIGPLLSGPGNITGVGIVLQNALNVQIHETIVQNVQSTSTFAGGINLIAVNGFSLFDVDINKISTSAPSSGASSLFGVNFGNQTQNGTVSKTDIHSVWNISSTTGGSRGMTFNTGVPISNIIVYNTSIADIISPQNSNITNSPFGVAIDGNTGGIKFYNSSINLSGDHAGDPASTSGGTSAAFAVNGTGLDFELYNVNLTNTYNSTTSGNDRSFPIISNNASQFSEMDFNNLYWEGPAGRAGRIGSTELNAIEQLYSAFNQFRNLNENSINVKPYYVSATNLHYQPIALNGLLNNAGKLLSGFAYDIDGEALDGTPPIGCDQVSGLAAPCITPTSVNALNITETIAQIGWTCTGCTGTFIIEYGVQGFIPGPGASSGVGGTLLYGVTSPHTITGLLPSEAYTIYVRQDCGGGVYSANSEAITFATKTANDLPVNATLLNVGEGCVGAPYSNAGASHVAGEPVGTCSETIGHQSVWYKFICPVGGAVKVSTDEGFGNTCTDTRVSLYSVFDPNVFSTFDLISCDDNNGSVLGDGKMSVLFKTGLIPGNTYYIQVDKFSATSEAGTFCIGVDALNTSMLATQNDCESSVQVPYGGSVNNYNQEVSVADANSNLVAIVKNPDGGSVEDIQIKQNISEPLFISNEYGKYINWNHYTGDGISPNCLLELFFPQTSVNALTAADGTTLNQCGATFQTDVVEGCHNEFNPANGVETFIPQSSSGTTNGVSWIGITGLQGSGNLYIGGSLLGGCVPPSITTPPLSQNACPGNTVTLSVSVTGTAPYTFEWYQFEGPIYIPVGTNSNSFTTPPVVSGPEFDYYGVKVTNACGNAISGHALIGAHFTATWTGAVDIDYNNPENWDTGCVPTDDMNVIIPSGGNPTITGGTVIIEGNVTIHPGGTLHLNDGATLQVKNNVINNGSVVSGGNPTVGKVIFNGTVQQQISGTGSFSNAEISNTVGVTVISNLNFKSITTLAGARLTINTSGTINIDD